MEKYFKVSMIICKKYLRWLRRPKQKITTIIISESPKKLIYLEMEEYVSNKWKNKYILEDIVVDELMY